MIKAIIIDDERKSGENLKALIEKYCKHLKVIATADSVESGIEAIANEKPQLVFLDIELNNGTGFDILSSLDSTDFEVIFTTAFEQYALKAIKFAAVDYLLKPIDVEELTAAVFKAEERLNHREANKNFEVLMQNLKSASSNHKIALPTTQGLTFVPVSHILRCEADGSYTWFYFKDGRKLIVSKKIKEYEELLSAYGFYRVHHSHLVNMEEIEKYVRGDGGYVVMTDGTMVDVSKRKREHFLAALDKA
ncbi:MAG: LytTR family DNA-binding domain-containing protein [Bacteroidia bacterium]